MGGGATPVHSETSTAVRTHSWLNFRDFGTELIDLPLLLFPPDNAEKMKKHVVGAGNVAELLVRFAGPEGAVANGIDGLRC
ncbi:hypothetical protein [Rhizobium lentis]|uniref:Uncharacterized protein n=1 Tax=Rhizobium lentis TaxID=1138194 RepID=A0A7W9CZ53_9HYPH|nr:hypothetical protein [Rhizobium lentis]MBB4577667.1 hypothetical protein [Rhizobium lentis]MBB5554229.1 hypothetical protein [Rhizobium lentis]MBB5564856.1 hypothetical protein [Rhizobium lentis]MBB5571372.1 hypothetical protein [Rhizobium lentis]